jgi:hypothetical protein
VNFVTFIEQKLSEIRPVLSGDSGNQCFFHTNSDLVKTGGARF